MPSKPGYKNLKATDLEELVDLLYTYARPGESLIDTVKRHRTALEYYADPENWIDPGGFHAKYVAEERLIGSDIAQMAIRIE